MELEVVQSADDRWQVRDGRGRLVHAAGSKEEAEGVRLGYQIGREDAAMILRGTVEGLAERVSLSRT
jgi:hypothetical protein